MPGQGADAAQSLGAVAPGAAIVTASYAPDFERCKLLCETIDRHVTGMTHHYILVERRDVALFKSLEGRNRSVIEERELLPSWLRPFDDPLSLFRRRVWLSTKTKPLRGWHVQQLRRIAIAAHADAGILVYCDSDVVFLKPFDCGAFRRDGKARLFRNDNGLPEIGDHPLWSENAGKALGIASPKISPHDYISTLIAWRRDTVNAMCARIEDVHGRHWIEVVAASRKFSECLIYGRYADELMAGAGHFHDSRELCRVHWTGSSLSDAGFRDFVAGMSEDQVAVGMQSFIGTDLSRIRRLIAEV
jgi:hypothetical protein